MSWRQRERDERGRGQGEESEGWGGVGGGGASEQVGVRGIEVRGRGAVGKGVVGIRERVGEDRIRGSWGRREGGGWGSGQTRRELGVVGVRDTVGRGSGQADGVGEVGVWERRWGGGRGSGSRRRVGGSQCQGEGWPEVGDHSKYLIMDLSDKSTVCV